ncbi:MAG TPA: caspase family protein, partial [Nitriliruptoraceae bacterium]|nr:caspase family protein [Nitriliruptoraceae bacterium]
MTLVVDRGTNGARVHALVIGVGAYRHLNGGEGPLAAQPFGLGQLTSPPVSAAAFVDWIETTMRHPEAELGSVELLLSPGSAMLDQGAVEVEVPTMENTRAAFDRWLARCDSNKDNVAVLYFSGHGIERESHMALLADFGVSATRPLENAVDVG